MPTATASHSVRQRCTSSRLSGDVNQPPPGTSFTNSQIDTRRQEGEIISSFHLGSWNTLTAGYENRAEQAYNRGSFRAAIETHSGFLQDEIRLFNRLFINGGVRYEDNSAFGSELTPRVSGAVLGPRDCTHYPRSGQEARNPPK